MKAGICREVENIFLLYYSVWRFIFNANLVFLLMCMAGGSVLVGNGAYLVEFALNPIKDITIICLPMDIFFIEFTYTWFEQMSPTNLTSNEIYKPSWGKAASEIRRSRAPWEMKFFLWWYYATTFPETHKVFKYPLRL